MDTRTISRLNAINQEFYRVTAASFDATRQAPWPGWRTLLAHLPWQANPPDSLRVLDVGCGNGRFGVFLGSSLPEASIHYHGLDSSPALLVRAAASLPAVPNLHTSLETRDLIRQPLRQPLGPGQEQYDLVVLFGVLHHIPGAAARQDLLRSLAAQVKPGGWLAWTAWCFYEDERLRSRIIPWPDDLAGDVEAHDYLLDWRRGTQAVRYCHYVDEAEHSALLNALLESPESGQEPGITFREDGRSGQMNRYTLLLRS